ncbi:maltose alpha-D-glucosyltransferase/ alpha-amylase [Palleronia marisminoris]|uniref:Maltokinase n=1 Tax=Palleronia marisminoris TaxID=315423 RepID=A0A1Y5SR18_9RHOB|nr:maltose alpha-D-glucosyltransferase [Palleronia marisminoris]SFG94268.1 maltose alpha-D-glucosyltransferase/ alpha-amylase [Palleronia marisminoris]SLN46220.1 Trehalose synthase/amylase TreS [Palleronia marisminoris]
MTKLEQGLTAVKSTSDAADWYKDAVIYQLHIKAYQDSNGDGVGDFRGLMQRLDHIQDLGATAIWVLPFYPSPLRDDGYDISEYKAINPSYGTMEDFENLVEEAHRRGLKVITELVINHTSDQHEWFQRARNAPKGSPERDFYVWSDDPQKWMDKTRVIFNDTHDSNWTWDPVAGQFFWHRFFDHQPDLNFDNPAVMDAVLDAMHFWLDKGVDGLRLDAIPYLVERDGTNNENLPETHDVLKAIRADLDKHYEGKMLLAEANQWPEDTRPYFGEGDECHMGFHFPLMPRMYMAVAQEDRYPISDIIRQTPEIPEDCQWAIFLRNHDELTLEMVTDRERDYLWDFYASDKRARINMGIRRRLAPLLQNDRRKIELLNSLLMSMPGTPIVYYGDEIGMGDNYYLGDRDGVRTPMQWTADRNAGFSRALPQELYLPTIQDPVYGYQAINVEAQQSSPTSQLNWIRRMIAVRQRHDVFGRGEIELLYPANRKVLAYLRRTETETVLCVANLSRQAQAAEIDLHDFQGRVPIEMTGQSAFPPVGQLPYLLTLPGYGFYWFLLTDADEAPGWHTPHAQTLPDFLTLTTRDGTLTGALSDRAAGDFVSQTLRNYLPLQRWFAAKENRIDGVSLHQLAALNDGQHMLSVADVKVGGGTQRYFLPLSAVWGEDALTMSPRLPATLAKLRRANRVGAILDGAVDEKMAITLLDTLREGRTVEAGQGSIDFTRSDRLDELGEDPGEPRLLSAEQSNASIAFSDKVILKLYRRLQEGVQPDIEVARFLTEETEFTASPALLGTIDWTAPDGGVTTLAAASEFVRNQGDAWTYVTEALDRDLERREMGGRETDPAAQGDQPVLGGPLDIGNVLGRRTAELHQALASGADGTAFSQEPLTAEVVTSLVDTVRGELTETLDRLQDRLGSLPEASRPVAEAVLERRDALLGRIEALRGMDPSGGIGRIHGDYHLGQVLVVETDVMIIDFEGEPARSLAERTAKTSPLRDVAGMMRSFDYALWSTLRRRIEFGADPERTMAHVEGWRRATQGIFLEAYRETATKTPLHPSDPAFEQALLDLFLIQKAGYEVGYEMAMRPDWVDIPLRGLLALAESASGET